MSRILISYRRSDTAGTTGRIFDRLVAHFGKDSVFMDVDNIPFGIDFRKHIRETLVASDVLLVVIGSRWFGEDADGKPRLDDETDPVRVEVEAALQQDIPILPVLVDRTPMPKAAQLPPSLREFAYRNAADVDTGRDFHQHVDRLIRGITQILEAPKRPPSPQPNVTSPPVATAAEPPVAAKEPAAPLPPPDSEIAAAAVEPPPPLAPLAEAPPPNAPLAEAPPPPIEPPGMVAEMPPPAADEPPPVAEEPPIGPLSGALVPLIMAVPAAFAAWKIPQWTVPSITLWAGAATLAALGVGILLLRLRPPNPQDYFGGLALSALALFALWASHDLGVMHGFAFGAGTAPRIFAILLAINGGLVTIGGLMSHGPEISRYAWRGLLFITLSVIIFALTVRSTGLVISTFVTALVCAAAAEDVRWRETMLVSVALTALCSFLFPFVLNLPMPLWPR